MDRLIRWEGFADVLQLRFLRVALHRDVAAFPGGPALLQGDVIEGAAAPQDHVQRPLLLRRRPQLLLEGFAYRLHRVPLWIHSTRHVQKWLHPHKVHLTDWVQTLRLAAGSHCHEIQYKVQQLQLISPVPPELERWI